MPHALFSPEHEPYKDYGPTNVCKDHGQFMTLTQWEMPSWVALVQQGQEKRPVVVQGVAQMLSDRGRTCSGPHSFDSLCSSTLLLDQTQSPPPG